MYNICLDVRLYHAAGIGTYLKEVVVPTFKAKDNCRLTFLCRQEDQNFFERTIPLKSPIFSLQEQIELPCKIPRSDLFYSPHFNIPLLPIRAKKRVTTICDAFHLDYDHTLSLPKKVYAKIFYNAALASAQHVITISSFSKTRLLLNCRKVPKRLTVIYPGINGQRFMEKIPEQALEKVRRKYHLPDRFILTVGNLKPHKNLKRFLMAYAQYLACSQDPISLVICGKKEGFICGETSLEKMINQDAKLQNRVHLTGYIGEEDLPAIYQMCAVFAYPSLYEGFGLPPLEAMAANRPVITSRAGSIPEVCGDAALYFDPLDVQDMECRLQQLLTNISLQETLIEKGKKRVALFSKEKSIREHSQLIDEVLE